MLNSAFKPLLSLSIALVLTLTIWCGPAAAIVLPPSLIAIFSFSGSRPANLGLQNGQLVACASTPNCVNSQATDAEHKIDPIRLNASPDKVWAALKQAILAVPKTAIVNETADYLYAEFTSNLLGFVDDVEFHLNPKAGIIAVRSASRLGESDLGVNRQRIEAIRETLKAFGNVAEVILK